MKRPDGWTRIAGGVTAARGFAAATARAGIKAGRHGADVALVVSDRAAVAAGLFTTNRVQAAPVVWSRTIVGKGASVRGVLLNSGNANACTGAAGRRAAFRSASTLAGALGITRQEVLLASTGVIGVELPVDRLLAAVPKLVRGLAPGRRAGKRAARAIMTTDTVPKESAVRVRISGHEYTVGGMAKGAGMIHPDVATMLVVLCCDAPLGRAQAGRLLRGAAATSFNMLTVDGDTSTNDSVFLLANGAAGGRVPPRSRQEQALAAALGEVCWKLATAIAADAEGATKLLLVHVRGARNTRAAQRVARTIAGSLLVKTAVHGGDPNWGRVMAAAGRAGVPFDPRLAELRIGGHLVARGGAAYPAGERAAARHLHGRRLDFALDIGRGPGRATALGSDLGPAYVRINAHYRT